ncbi:MAG: glycosyltransferase family 2 protein, partial [Bdellovibrionales bacterium]|nr:glycosyltransferase family 2 protein [Bdellovibrionales bacterium]
FGIANNIGIKSALNSKAEYVFLLNQDAKIEPSTIRTLIHSSVENPSFGVLAPIAFNYDGTGLDPHCINYLCNNSCNYLSDLVTNRSSSVYELPFYPAAAWLVSASALKQIGGFDPLFFMYGEDFDFAQRARRAGFKVGLVPHAKYFHHRGPKPTRANHTYWEYVVWLKGTDSPFLKSLANIWRESFLRILRALAYFDLKMAREVLEALIDIHKQLRTIKKHRELCKSGTGVFLER